MAASAADEVTVDVTDGGSWADLHDDDDDNTVSSAADDLELCRNRFRSDVIVVWFVSLDGFTPDVVVNTGSGSELVSDIVFMIASKLRNGASNA
jgi:hypothetical protein